MSLHLRFHVEQFKPRFISSYIANLETAKEKEACYGLLDKLSMVMPIGNLKYWKERVRERELAESKRVQIGHKAAESGIVP